MRWGFEEEEKGEWKNEWPERVHGKRSQSWLRSRLWGESESGWRKSWTWMARNEEESSSQRMLEMVEKRRECVRFEWEEGYFAASFGSQINHFVLLFLFLLGSGQILQALDHSLLLPAPPRATSKFYKIPKLPCLKRHLCPLQQWEMEVRDFEKNRITYFGIWKTDFKIIYCGINIYPSETNQFRSHFSCFGTLFGKHFKYFKITFAMYCFGSIKLLPE